MNSLNGRIEEIFVADGVTRARVDFGNRSVEVALTLLLNAKVGDDVVVGSGVALERIEAKRTNGGKYVLSHTR